jgi:hypothetical protein
MYALCGCAFLYSSQALRVLALTPLPSSPTVFQYILTSSTFTCGITVALSFSFTFPLSPSSIEEFCCYKHVLHLSLYVIVLVFVSVFIFGSIFHI